MYPDLNEQLVNEHSMHELYTKKYLHPLAKIKQVIRSIVLNDFQAKLLKQPENDLALTINHRLFV